jgi:hypothetical protein
MADPVSDGRKCTTTYVRDKVVELLDPAHFGGKLTFARLAQIMADPDRPGCGVPVEILQMALNELESEGKIARADRSYTLTGPQVRPRR